MRILRSERQECWFNGAGGGKTNKKKAKSKPQVQDRHLEHPATVVVLKSSHDPSTSVGMTKKGRGRGEAERRRGGEEKSRSLQCAADARARERRKKTGRFGRDDKKKKSRVADPAPDQVGAGGVNSISTWSTRPQQQIRSGARAGRDRRKWRFRHPVPGRSHVQVTACLPTAGSSDLNSRQA